MIETWVLPLMQAPWVQTMLSVSLLVMFVLLLHFVGRRYVLRGVNYLVRKSRTDWDEVLFEHKVPHRLSLLIPLLAFQAGLSWVPGLTEVFAAFLLRLANATTFLIVALSFDAFLSAVHTIYARSLLAATRPIKSYVQLVKVFVYLVATVFIIAQLADQPPWFFVSGLGAMMAIILLIFRDTLLSLVASVQLTNNDLIRVGDWIEMPQFDADGDVVDIALHTVKIQNWDRTITVIPTHKFLDHSFKNWRGMFEGGGRRIKRSIFINMNTIRFLTPAETARIGRFVLLRDYVALKTRELEEHNASYADDPDAIVNARRLTNVGTFRAYIINYLKSHPGINRSLIQLVRQLDPTPEGLPIEIYVFTKDTSWGTYEGVQADIFDHLLAIAPEFGLRVYQRPSGNDLTALVEEGIAAPARTRVHV